MLGDLLLLGFTLSLDNFRNAVALGTLRLKWRQAGQVALALGSWDAAAPAAGIFLGRYLGGRFGASAEAVGAIALGSYGLYLLARAWRTPAPDEYDELWALFGLPLPLSLDNVVAGTSVGLLGFSPRVTAPIFGAITAVMSLVGLQLGRVAANLIRIRSDALAGVALVGMAAALAWGCGCNRRFASIYDRGFTLHRCSGSTVLRTQGPPRPTWRLGNGSVSCRPSATVWPRSRARRRSPTSSTGA